MKIHLTDTNTNEQGVKLVEWRSIQFVHNTAADLAARLHAALAARLHAALDVRLHAYLLHERLKYTFLSNRPRFDIY